jgi:hypothetical protein
VLLSAVIWAQRIKLIKSSQLHQQNKPEPQFRADSYKISHLPQILFVTEKILIFSQQFKENFIPNNLPE